MFRRRAIVPSVPTLGQSRQSLRKADASEVWSVGTSKDEALLLYRMVHCGKSSLDDMRDMIAVGEENKAVLLGFAAAYPEYRGGIMRAIKFREHVLSEFESIVSEVGRRDVRALQRREQRVRGGRDSGLG